MQYYTDLVWTRMAKEAMGKKGETMKGMEEILKIPGAGEKCIKILVVGVCNFLFVKKRKILFAAGKP